MDSHGFLSNFPSTSSPSQAASRNMAQRAEEYQRWWQIAAPVVQAGRLDGMDNGIGHMAVEVGQVGQWAAP
jgi:L-rhamnose mutarotase